MKFDYSRVISLGAAIALIGYISSGPVAFTLVRLVKPQPAWISPATFAENYNVIQDVPYYFGFLLIGGMLMLVAGHYLNYPGEDNRKKFQLLVAFGCTIVFCTLISFNYICQTTFVRNLALNYKPEYDAAIFTFSLANPLSFCWANEMWGYAILGVATWTMACYYEEKNRFIRTLLIINGILSLASALWTALDVSWVMTTSGLIGYFTWNVLMIVAMISIYHNVKRTDNEAE